MSISKLSLQIAVAQTAYPGFALEDAGDRYVVEHFDQGVLLAAIDGLGHGPKAATAAIAAANTLKQHPHESPKSLLEHCHRTIRSTRGAVISLASINILNRQMTWMGVGNVKGVLLRADSNSTQKREHLLLRAGTVGFRLPTLRPSQLTINPYDVLIFVTDGIRSGFLAEAPVKEPPQQLADHILEHHKRDTDDALVVVAKAAT